MALTSSLHKHSHCYCLMSHRPFVTDTWASAVASLLVPFLKMCSAFYTSKFLIEYVFICIASLSPHSNSLLMNGLFRLVVPELFCNLFFSRCLISVSGLKWSPIILFLFVSQRQEQMWYPSSELLKVTGLDHYNYSCPKWLLAFLVYHYIL